MRIGWLITVVLALLSTGLLSGPAVAGGPSPIPSMPGWLCWPIIIILIVIIIYLWQTRRRP